MEPGDVIDSKYKIEVQLGEGGMGRVLAASHMALGNMVAIKLLKADALRHPEVPARFMREARAAGRLRSEHVVKVMDVGQLESGEPFMVMEMLHGADLATYLKSGPVPAPLAVEYIAQSCEGLAEAHALGMVHRDIKPANLFVTKRPNGAPLVKVLDFGIATAAFGDIDHRLTSTQTVIGSPSYMSPEQLRAARDVDQRSDIWSLGVTLYELLCGEQPFVGPTLTALTLKIVGEPHARIEGISDPLNAILDRCLQKDRQDRYANVAELARDLAPLFPNGGLAAEMVAGSLSQPVAPTLMGLPSTPSGVEPTIYPEGSVPVGWQPPPSQPIARHPRPITNQAMTSTTGLAAGESAAMQTMIGRKRTWIALGAAGAVIAAVATFAVIGTRGGSSSPPVQPATGAPPAPPAAAAAPTAQPIETPAPAASPEPAGSAEPAVRPEPVVTPPEPAAVVEPPKQRDRKRPRRPKRTPKVKDPRTPVEPTEYTNPPKRTPVNPPVTTPPKKKLPCAPNDPRCGL